MYVDTNLTASDAITKSQNRNEIVHVAPLQTMVYDLSQACEDWTEAEVDEFGDYIRVDEFGDHITEYWGRDEGGEWRVHVHG